MPFDVEGLLFIFNRYTADMVSVDQLIADVVAHEIETCHARAVLQQALDARVLEWVQAANAARRPG